MLKIDIIFIAAFERGMTAPDRLGERATALETQANILRTVPMDRLVLAAMVP